MTDRTAEIRQALKDEGFREMDSEWKRPISMEAAFALANASAAEAQVALAAANTRIARLEDALGKIIGAWESVSEGHHSIRIMQKWLCDDMAPAMTVARAALAHEAGEERG